MIFVSLTIDGASEFDPLMREWIKHYVNMLGENWKLLLRQTHYSPDGRSEGICTNWFRLAKTIRVNPEDVRGTEDEARQTHKQLREMGMTDGDLYSVIDLDEFWKPPCPVAELVRRMESAGLPYCIGRMIDRFAADGSLAELRPGDDIWTRYPIESKFTRAVLVGGDNKVFLARGNQIISNGHHEVFGRPVIEAPGILGGDLYCHHFKWRHGLIERMKRILATSKPVLSTAWESEARRCLSIIEDNGGKIPMPLLRML
jgi:hypothetical protein